MTKKFIGIVAIATFWGCGEQLEEMNKQERKSLRGHTHAENGDIITKDGEYVGSADATAEGGLQPDGSTQTNTTSGNTTNNNNPQVEPPDDNDPPKLDPAAGGDPNIVVFRIAAGTGENSWNTADTMIVARVGQTIRFVNEDSMSHQLHTNGSPCRHGTLFRPGETFDCVVSREYDSMARRPLYEHNVGPSAEVWIQTLPADDTSGFALTGNDDGDEEEEHGSCH